LDQHHLFIDQVFEGLALDVDNVLFLQTGRAAQEVECVAQLHSEVFDLDLDPVHRGDGVLRGCLEGRASDACGQKKSRRHPHQGSPAAQVMLARLSFAILHAYFPPL
jgi:hypothetical protein